MFQDVEGDSHGQADHQDAAEEIKGMVALNLEGWPISHMPTMNITNATTNIATLTLSSPLSDHSQFYPDVSDVRVHPDTFTEAMG